MDMAKSDTDLISYSAIVQSDRMGISEFLASHSQCNLTNRLRVPDILICQCDNHGYNW